MQQLLDDIRTALHCAEKEKKKAAMLHSLVLIPEVQKMLSATRVLAELGYAVQKIKQD